MWERPDPGTLKSVFQSVLMCLSGVSSVAMSSMCLQFNEVNLETVEGFLLSLIKAHHSRSLICCYITYRYT